MLTDPKIFGVGMVDLMEIRIELLKRGITQRQLALHLGVSDSYLSDILRSIKPVNSDLIREIKQAIEDLSQNRK